MKKALILLLFLLPASLMWLSCGGTPSSSTTTSGIKYRAFITNGVTSSSGAAGVFIVDAMNDVLPPVSPISAGNTPGMMVLTPNRAQTLVFSGIGTQFSDNQLSVISNASEAVASHLTLPGLTESFVVSPDSSTAYVAVPTAQVVGQSPGVVEAISLSSGAVTATISCPPLNPNPPNPPPPPVCVTSGLGDQGFNPPYHFLFIGNTGNRVLAFSEGSDAVANVVAVITPSSVGTANPVVAFVPGFDHPVAAFFSSDDSIAYVLNCGAECGGQQASIQQLNLTDNTLGSKVALCTSGANPQCAGSVALVNGSTMYVAGTPYSAGGGPSQLCPPGTTQATYCGMLSVVDLSGNMAVTSSGIVIPDGYHTKLAMGANGQLFIGSRTCTEITTTTETRGCLAIYNTLPATTVGSVPPGGVLIPPVNGDVTGIQPIAARTVVYVIQDYSLSIYDATIDALEFNPNDPNQPGQIMNLVGQFIDVKTVDF